MDGSAIAYRERRFLLCSLSLLWLAILAFGGFSSGAQTTAIPSSETVADTKFSTQRGFFSTNFSLFITCATPGATIYYTTNGSEPSATNGTALTGPITISHTSIVRARAVKPGAIPSNVDTHTYLFLSDVLTQSTNGAAPPGWPARWGDNKVDYGMDPDIVSKPPWSGTISNDLRSIPTISLVMRLADLFDARTGIYANPGGEGSDWERPCSVELIHPDGRAGFAVRAGVRIRGGFSRNTTNPKHSFRFVMRDEYGDSKLKYPFFGPTGASEFDKFDLRTSQDGSWAFLGDPNGLFLNDPFARDTLLATGQPAERGDWYHLYINGQYWGLYNSCERPEASFASSYLGGLPEDWDVLKPDPQEGYVMKVTDGTDAAWTRLWRAATNGFSSNANYFRVQGRNADGTANAAFENLLDVPNLIDYLLVIFWTGDFDGPLYGDFDDGFLNNYYALRERTGARGGFRFLTHDAELSLGSLDENRINTTTIGDPAHGDGPERCNPYYLWTRLLPNAEFKMLVADRIQKHFFNAGALTREAAMARFAARTNELYRAMTGESARWGDAQRSSPITPNSWRNAVTDKMQDYFPFRANVVLDQLHDAGVFPSVAAPNFARASGQIDFGGEVALSHTNLSGEIYYTADGSDPRAVGGGISFSAIHYDFPVAITGSTTIRARVRDGGNWSPIGESAFFTEQDFSSLRITEIHYHPPGSEAIDGDEFEFLELKNIGNTEIDLGGLSFSGITFTFTNGTRLRAGQFFLLGRNPVEFAARYSKPLNGVYTGKLENGGERISLMTPSGAEVLAVAYADRSPWPIAPDGHGFSLVPAGTEVLEKMNEASHWRASSSIGGSPGADDPSPAIAPIVINEILAHSDLPAIDKVELYNPSSTEVNLAGWFLTDDPGEPRKFRIPNGTVIAPGGYAVFSEENFNSGSLPFSLSSDGDEVYLLSGSLTGTNLTGYSHGVKFGASAAGVSLGRTMNSAGEELFPSQEIPSFGAFNNGPTIGPVVINEIQYHPLTNYDEYVELLNLTSSPLHLFDPEHVTNSWRIDGLGFEFPPESVIPANGLALVVGMDPVAFRAKYGVGTDVPIFGPFAGNLQDSGEYLSLQRPDSPQTNGVVPYLSVDDVRYNDRAPWPPAADGDGPALQRMNPASFGNEPTNWFASGFTPGRINHLNKAPMVTLLAPSPEAEFTLPTTITLEAAASDSDGTIAQVEFYDGTTRIGVITSPPYRMTWTTPASGIRQLTARARDNEMGSSSSPPVSITVHPPVLGSGFGLRAEYFDDADLSGEPILRVDPNIDFTWPEQPLDNIRADGFSVRWTGRIQPLVSGVYTFHTLSSDGVRLWIAGTNLVNHWNDHAETEDTATIPLQAGQLYDLKLEYYNASGESRIQFAWSAPGLARQSVPAAQLYPPVNAVNEPPSIILLNPRDNSGFAPGNLIVNVSAQDHDGAIYKVQFFSDGLLLGESGSPPFQFAWANPGRGAHAITATAIDDNLVSTTTPPVMVHIVNGFTTNETILAAGSSWKYWDRGPLPSANWTLPAFDDSGWSNGLAEFGYGDNDERTVLGFGPDANDKYVTTYFRKSISLPNPETVTGLRLRIIRDDGVAIYWNGQELVRDNLPGGDLDFSTLALNAFGTPDENTFIVRNVPAPGTFAGLNLLACELHQGAPDSTDISFDLELAVTRSLLAPFIISQPTDVSATPGATLGFDVSVKGAPPLLYQWRKDQLDIPGENKSTLDLRNFNAATAGNYSVVIANSLGAVTSHVARASVVTNTNAAPQIQISINSGQPGIRISKPAGAACHIEMTSSLSLASWQVFTNIPPSSMQEVFPLGAAATNQPRAFFRIVFP